MHDKYYNICHHSICGIDAKLTLRPRGDLTLGSSVILGRKEVTAQSTMHTKRMQSMSFSGGMGACPRKYLK